MTTILAAMQDSLLVLHSTKNGWKMNEQLIHHHPNSIAFDAKNYHRAYCGTFDGGLWKTDDGGLSWEEISLNSSGFHITSVSTSSTDNRLSGLSKLFVGMEPSIICSSNDGGQTWEKIDGFNKLKSSSTWSFPPRPWTHHVRWIEPDKNKNGYIFAAIEAGALIQSLDGGKTWIDRVEYSPYDTHVLRTHKKAPGRLYSAAGDGYFESEDYGNSWKKDDNGLDFHTYLFGLALNSNDPQNMIVSAASNAWKSHYIQDLESFLYRRLSDEKQWNLITNGIPNPKGTVISIVESNPNIGDEFYCLNNKGIYCSKDSGISWERLEIPWPTEYKLQHPWALAVQD